MWFITRLILTNSNWKPPWSDLDFVFFAGERANLRLWGVSLRVSGLADLPQLVLHPRHVLFEIFPWILFCVPQGFLQWCMRWRWWPIPSQAPGSAGLLHSTASRLFIRLSVCTILSVLRKVCLYFRSVLCVAYSSDYQTMCGSFTKPRNTVAKATL